mgnify:CR=1 FL=1
MKKVLLAAIALSMISSSALAASPSPSTTSKASPTPTSKISAKASVKPTALTTTKATTKTTAKATTSATPKVSTSASATKKTVVKKRIYRPRPKPTVSVKASPSVAWPPKGFFYDNQSPDIYSKIPTNKELIGLASSSTTLAKQLTACESTVCGAILAASTAGCSWWKFNSEVRGPASDTDNSLITYGTLVSMFSSSKPKQILPFVLISSEPIKAGFVLSKINIECHRDAAPNDIKFPSNTYTKQP